MLANIMPTVNADESLLSEGGFSPPTPPEKEANIGSLSSEKKASIGSLPSEKKAR